MFDELRAPVQADQVAVDVVDDFDGGPLFGQQHGQAAAESLHVALVGREEWENAFYEPAFAARPSEHGFGCHAHQITTGNVPSNDPTRFHRIFTPAASVPASAMRMIGPHIGARGWAHHAKPYMLPKGLADGERITVVGKGDQSLTVRTVDGREFDVPAWLVDIGREYQLPGESVFVHESDPRVLDMLERWNAALALDQSAYGEQYGAALIETNKMVLARNGRLIPSEGGNWGEPPGNTP